ncbi:MAG: hypothetical protein R3E01_36185 [Pirellulaceae bacterium]
MEVHISENVEKIVQQLVAQGQFPDAESAVNAMFLRGVKQQNGLDRSSDDVSSDERPFEKAVRLGLVGAARGLPADLSFNPQHMQGFGRS